MSATRSKIFLITFALLVTYATCARVLGLFPHVGRSHAMVFQPLLRRLAERGHHVTTVSYFPMLNPPANYTDVSLGSTDLAVGAINISMFENRSLLMKVPVLNTLLNSIFEVNRIRYLALIHCEKILSRSLGEVLRQQYDVVLMENFNSDCMLGLLHVYNNKAPIVGLSSCGVMPWSPSRFGLPDNPAYVPGRSTSFSDTMSFQQRLENTIVNVYLQYWYNQVQEKERAMVEKHYRVKIPDLAELAKEHTVLLLHNTFHALNLVRPLLPASIEVGGMHLHRKSQIIPTYIERFLNESEHGVILLSFGSLIKTSTIPKYKEDIIVNTLAKFKQRVIWKYEDSGEEGTLTGNILRVKWLPQYELLQHKKIVAFIAHGGLLGMTEAVSAGKPMVVVPFFGDQPANAAAAAAVGFAKVVPYIELTEKALTEALETVLSAETRLKARRVSSIWKDRQTDPLETAVYWTERVIRWGHSAPLHSAARDMPLYQLALIDVIATLFVAILILLTLSWYILSMVFRLLFTKESKLKMH